MLARSVMRLVLVLTLVVFPAFVLAAAPVPRAAPSAAIQSEDPDPGEEDEGNAPELRDEDDGFDDGRDLPSAPAGRGRPRPGTPGVDEEEPPPPPDLVPSQPGPAEPASAMQPASPH